MSIDDEVSIECTKCGKPGILDPTIPPERQNWVVTEKRDNKRWLGLCIDHNDLDKTFEAKFKVFETKRLIRCLRSGKKVAIGILELYEDVIRFAIATGTVIMCSDKNYRYQDDAKLFGKKLKEKIDRESLRVSDSKFKDYICYECTQCQENCVLFLKVGKLKPNLCHSSGLINNWRKKE